MKNNIDKDALPKGVKETMLKELKELFLPYWSESTDNIITVPAMDAAELALKLIRRWSKDSKSGKAAGTANIRLMGKLQTPEPR